MSDEAANEAGLRRAARAFLGLVRQRHIRHGFVFWRTQLRQHAARAGLLFGAGPDNAIDVSAVVAGHRGVDGQRVGVVDVVVHRADQRRMVHLPGQFRQMLAQVDAGGAAANRLKFAADLDRCVWFHVPHVEMARPAIEKNHDAGVGTRPDAALGRPLIGGQQLRQMYAHQPQRAELQESATRHGRRVSAWHNRRFVK